MSKGGRTTGFHKTGILSHLKAYLDRSRLGELLVIKGLISTKDLRFALAEQKAQSLPLGKIFIQHSMITRRQLAFVLARQYALRIVATVLLLSFSGLGASKRARAEENGPAPITIAMAAGAQTATKPISYPMFLGSKEKRSTNLSAFTKWSGVFSRFERELRSASATETVRQWRENLNSLRGLPLIAMAERVNDLMNKKPYILDNRNWGKSDYWETPVEFMNRGGDCEDFAIAKYVSLRELGVPESRMRLAIVQDTQKNIPHAVLALYTDDGGVVILDQQIKTVFDAGSQGRYKPIFSINREAWWLHTAPDTTQVASR